MKTIGETVAIRLLIIAVVASMALIPLMLYGCGPEWARWDATQAVLFFRDGEVDEALYQLRDAVRKSPRDPVLKLTLAERLIEIGQSGEALELANEVLGVYPENANAIAIKSSAQQHQGNFSAALETQLEYDESLNASSRGSIRLNELAYYRALASEEVHLAKRDIETAVATTNRYTNWTGSGALTYPAKATILASLVARCCGMEQDALWTVSQQIETLRKQIVEARNELAAEVYKDTLDAFPVRRDGGLLNFRQQLRFYETNAAALLSCRALIYQDLGDQVRCIEDRQEVTHLGFDSSKIVANFPSEKSALMSLGTAGAYLDTRGFISGMLPWVDTETFMELTQEQHNFVSSYANAIRDLNIAILCVETDRKSFDFSLRNSIDFMAEKKESQQRLNRQAAVLLYHRQIIHERAGKLAKAKADAERIDELGFESGVNLF
jgi:tetratricopeptide (TPR) repeat protein